MDKDYLNLYDNNILKGITICSCLCISSSISILSLIY